MLVHDLSIVYGVRSRINCAECKTVCLIIASIITYWNDLVNQHKLDAYLQIKLGSNMSAKPEIKYRADYRIPDFTITDIDLRFELSANLTTVKAISQLKRLNPAATELRLQGEKLTLKALLINGTPWHDYQLEADDLIIRGMAEEFELTIINEISPAANTALEGLYQTGDALCTQCEAEGFHHITWYLDRPDVLATFSTTLIADEASYPYLLSNGNKISGGKKADGKHWVTWQDPFPKPCYLFAIVAGDFEVLKDEYITCSGRQVALEIFVDHGNLDRASWAMTALKRSMRWDETRFNLEYDLDIYMIVAVDFFNMGAMENKGLNIFNSRYVLARAETATDSDYLSIEAVIGHEYFHNWSGNRVTCRDWFQLSLKEGLTVFRDQEFSSDLGSRAVNRIKNVKVLRSAQFAEDASPMAHPIRPDQVMEMNNFYTLTVYEKGSEVIRMLHTLLGETLFQEGIALYFDRHDGTAATCEDFIQAMETVSSLDLTQFRRWYSQSGTPIVTVTDDYDPNENIYRLTVKQHTPPTPGQPEKLPLHIPLNIELYDLRGEIIPLQYQGETVTNILHVTEEEQTFIFDKVNYQPVPALLREFSAPVKLVYPWQDLQLAFLMQTACDAFSRWDAAQSLLANYIKINVRRYCEKQTLSLPHHVVEAFKQVLNDSNLDPELRALMLTLPSESEIAEWFEVIDPVAIAEVRQSLMRTFSQAMLEDFYHIYQQNLTEKYYVTHQDIGKRALKNVCLSYLALSQDGKAEPLVSQQFQLADNMTDMQAALSAAVYAQLPIARNLLSVWEMRWHKDGLVMDKWFTLQSTSSGDDVLDTVRHLLTHRSFSMDNPNRVRALVGAFVQGNPAAFHREDGSGYQFLKEMLIHLNSRNPQVASRLIEPLIRFRRYGAQRQQKMRETLQELYHLPDLSRELYEKISRALAA